VDVSDKPCGVGGPDAVNYLRELLMATGLPNKSAKPNTNPPTKNSFAQ
jgi:hypothetical protein